MSRASIKGPFPPIIPISAPCPRCGGRGGRTDEGTGPGGLILLHNSEGDRDSFQRARYMIGYVNRICGTIEEWSYELGFCLACWTPRPGSKLLQLLDIKRSIESNQLEAEARKENDERNANW